MDVAKKRIVFLCSGGGGNLCFILRSALVGWLNAEVVAVITDRPCQATRIAEKNGILNFCVDFKEPMQTALRAEIDRCRPDLIITTVHKILSPHLLSDHPGKFVNLHYSLLPSFGGSIGSTPLQAALKYGARLVGVTAHVVDESVDGGPPLVQAAIPTREADDDTASLMDLIFRCGCLALLSAVEDVLSGYRLRKRPEVLMFQGRPCLFSSIAVEGLSLEDEKFWAYIKEMTQVAD